MSSLPIADRLGSLTVTEPIDHDSLRVFPLMGESKSDPVYELFTKETADRITVTEVDKEGQVPDVRIRNDLDVRVLLIDGQELVGAKQNRILNSDLLVAAGSECLYPVTCVEQGRWRSISRCFSSGSSASRAVRARSSGSVFRSLKEKMGHRSDQLGVWRDVAAMNCLSGARSPSSSMSDSYTHRREELETAHAALTLPDEAVGVAIYGAGQFLGLDVFDRSATLHHYWRSLVDSYVLDWLVLKSMNPEPENAVDDDAEPRPVIQELVNREWESFDSPGEGRDARWASEGLTAAALVWEDREVIHLAAFASPTAG